MNLALLPKRGCHGDGGLDVFGAHSATRKQQAEKQRKDATDDETHDSKEISHRPIPPVGLLLRRTGMPATRESDGSTITSSVGCRPETISTLLPESRLILTGTNSALPLRTSPTCKPSLRKINVFDGMVTERVSSGSLRCTKTYAPGRSWPLGFSTSTSTSNVREAMSMELALRTRVPWKTWPGNSSRVKVAGAPERAAREYTSGTDTYSRSLRMATM